MNRQNQHNNAFKMQKQPDKQKRGGQHHFSNTAGQGAPPNPMGGGFNDMVHPFYPSQQSQQKGHNQDGYFYP